MAIEFPNDSPIDFTAAKKYLSDRAIPTDAFTMDKCHLAIVGTNDGWNLLNRLRPPNDHRVGIVIHFPETDYYSVRWVGPTPISTITGTASGNSIEGQSGKPVPCYIPDFVEIKDTMYICESPLKALTLCLRGYPAIASNGVWSMWRRQKGVWGWAHGFPMPEMELVSKVVILFDNDIATSAKLGLSVRRLGDQLQTHYPDKQIMHRPLLNPEDGGKWGIDDAIATLGDEWLTEWLANGEEVPVVMGELQRHYDELNEDYCVIKKDGSVVHKASGSMLSSGKFTGVSEANRIVLDEKERPVPVSKLWLTTEERAEVDRVMYVPGSPMVCEYKGETVYNPWRDDGVEAVEGNIAPFLKVYENSIPDKIVRDLLFKSLAWMMQNRGTKLNKMFFFYSQRMGTGKSLLANAIGQCFGRRNYASIADDNIRSTFNSAFAAKEFVALDDLHQLGPSGMAKIKKMVTDSTVMVNPKGVREYEIDNYTVFFATSNEHTAMPLKHGDRRVLVIHAEPTVHYESGSAWWGDLVQWMERGGHGHLRYWLENLDLSDYDPNFQPPFTETKSHMVESSFSPEEEWVNDLFDNPDNILGKNKRSVFTAKELWNQYSGGAEANRRDVVAFGAALGTKFYRVATPNGKVAQIKVEGSNDRYWKVRDASITADEAKDNIRSYPNAARESQ